jgi:hypothetical protein
MHEQKQEPKMKHPLSFLGGLLAGMCVMYYLDGVSGASRRARLHEMLSASRAPAGRMTPATDMQPEDAQGDQPQLQGDLDTERRAMSPGGTPWH